MNWEELQREFERRYCRPETSRKSGYSSRLLRCSCGRHAVAAVACSDPGKAAKAFGAAVSWHMKAKRSGPLQYVLGKDTDGEWRKALYAIQGLIAQVGSANVLVDFEPSTGLARKDLAPPGWVAALLDEGKRQPPANAIEMAKGAEVEGFRWYRSVTGQEWSGRIDGLEVCSMSASGSKVTFGVGSPSRAGDHEARLCFSRFIEKTGSRWGAPGPNGEVVIDLSRAERIESAARLLAALNHAGVGAFGEEEHRLEAMMLRGDVKVKNAAGEVLQPVDVGTPFQFPAKWWGGKGRRFVDVMARTGGTPWLVELKVEVGQGEYYRDGIVQVALYRNYVLEAPSLNGWFKRFGLEREKARAALVIPPLRGPQAAELRADHRETARRFGVELIECPAAANPPERGESRK